MYRLIAADLDETLLKSDKHVSEEDIATIGKMKNVRFVPATGRGFFSIQNTLKEIGLYDKEDQYVISYNGAVITENKGNRIIHLEPLGYPDTLKLFDIGQKYDVCIHLYTLDNCFAYRIFENERQYLKNRIKVTEFASTDISFIENDTILKVLYCNSDIEYLRKIKEELDLDDVYDVSLSANRYLEFNRKGVNKGLGLRKLAEYLNIDIKDTIAVGDSLNDLAMVKEAGLGIGVKNSTIDIIDDCDIILDSTNNESPITEIYERFIKKTED
ncbi:MAG: Cof-type HAD-IIB family hydrolase [Erysipelotrichaceae bacterium]|nr:Cof-type HAD-IIB family hydrolase [Erysipelotrichaceae bacterium]